MNEASTDQNQDRIQRALEGLLSPEEDLAFKQDVIRDADLREAYVEQRWLHAALKLEAEQLSASPTSHDTEIVKPRLRWPKVALITTAAAASLALAAFTGHLLPSRSLATLVQADNCKWAGSELPTVVNARLGAGRLVLLEGIATLKFQSGATVTMEAPTTLEILTRMHCRLVEGTVTADVPEPAHGFTIDTPDIKVVDLGTKFGVTASNTGNSQVRVFEGEVKIGDLSGGETKLLTEGKGINVNGHAPDPGQETVRETMVREPEGWTSISTAFGKGKDSYVRRSYDKAHGAESLILVKHTDLPLSHKNERRALLSFDLSGVDAGLIHEAQLVLDPEPSGLGFSSLVPDSRFTIYGLVDDANDGWAENEVQWAATPGCNDGGVLPGQAERLAEFWIPRGGSGDAITIRSDALTAFLQADSNRQVTFLIVRETSESDPSGLAHGFASKEHPTARPPTLRFR